MHLNKIRFSFFKFPEFILLEGYLYIFIFIKGASQPFKDTSFLLSYALTNATYLNIVIKEVT